MAPLSRAGQRPRTRTNWAGGVALLALTAFPLASQSDAARGLVQGQQQRGPPPPEASALPPPRRPPFPPQRCVAQQQQNQQQTGYIGGPVPAGVPAASRPVPSIRAALSDPSIGRVVVLRDWALPLWLWRGTSAARPVVIGRNVTIEGARPDVLLDFGFLTSRVLLAPRVWLTFRNLTLARTRFGAGVGIDMLMGSGPTSVLFLNDAVRVHAACARPERWVALTKTHRESILIVGK